MHILYGVQATGQGHISRARAMSAALARQNVQVTWLFSGRPRDELFDMEPFGNYQHRRGLTFTTEAGQVQYGATILNNNPVQFIRDAARLDLSPFDLLVTDYEPIVAWAAKYSGRSCIGIGHQYAFGQDTPVSGSNWISKKIMNHFAPVDIPLGLHWLPYADNVLPPILDLPSRPLSRSDHVLVYLPFEDQGRITWLLQQIPDQRFIQYTKGPHSRVLDNVCLKPSSIATFKQDLASCYGVICNTGFELISECLHWGKPVLTKPLARQMEQLSNALALQQLGHARVVNELSIEKISSWLHTHSTTPSLHFPDVALVLAQWLASTCQRPPEALARELWRDTYHRMQFRLTQNQAA